MSSDLVPERRRLVLPPPATDPADVVRVLAVDVDELVGHCPALWAKALDTAVLTVAAQALPPKGGA